MLFPHVRRRLLAGSVTGALLALGTLAGPAGAEPSATAGPPAPAAASVEEYDAPLEVSIDALTPGVLPTSGPLVVSGRVTNRDLETWQQVNLYPMFNAGSGCEACPGVMTTAEEVEAAAASDPESPVGVRYTDDEAVRAEVDVLAPGQSASYSIRIPQSVLRTLFPAPETGVYWFGVHAVGQSASTPRDLVADGRARTFLPSVASEDRASAARVPTAVVVPLRARIAHAADGELGRTLDWEESLRSDGDLGGALALGAASQDAPVTWLLDPALPDAVTQLAAGNPTRAITPVAPVEEPTEGEEASEGGSQSPSGEPSDEGEEGGDGADEGAQDRAGQPTLPEDSTVISAASTWLTQARAALGTDAVALLPYGDPDIAAAAAWLPELYRTARSQPAATLTSWGITGTLAVGSPNGYLDALAIDSVDDGAAILLGDRSLPTDSFAGSTPLGATIGDSQVVVTSHDATRGGPGPDDRQAPVAIRQRILSEAVLRLLRAADDADPEPLVVVLPTGLDAAGADAFWSGLSDAEAGSVLRLTNLPGILGLGSASSAGEIDPETLNYPPAQQKAELSGSVLAEANRLLTTSSALQGILGDDYAIGTELTGEVLVGTSYAVRDDPDAGPRLGRTYDWVADQLGQVSIDAPAGVTLSSDTGSFNVAVGNGMDQPISVQIEVTADSGATIEVANPIVLAANSRTSVPISATLDGTGVRNVTLRLTDPEGRTIGAEDTVPIRSGQVGAVIWVIIGSGVAILFVAIGIRLYRRFRGAGATSESAS